VVLFYSHDDLDAATAFYTQTLKLTHIPDTGAGTVVVQVCYGLRPHGGGPRWPTVGGHARCFARQVATKSFLTLVDITALESPRNLTTAGIAKGGAGGGQRVRGPLPTQAMIVRPGRLPMRRRVLNSPWGQAGDPFI
jgi:hypothetical protein